MGKGARRRTVKDQRLKPGNRQPVQKGLWPWPIIQRHYAKTRVVRAAQRRVHIQVPTGFIALTQLPEVLQHLFQTENPARFITIVNLLPATAKQPVDVISHIAFSRTQR